MSQLREAAQQALEALQYHTEQTRPISQTNDAIAALRAALEAEQPVSNTYKSGKCIACGNPSQDPTQEHFVAATASEGARTPEDSNPQRVEAPQDMVDRIADCLVEDHIALMNENRMLREKLAKLEAEPVVTDHEGRPMTYWGGKAPAPKPEAEPQEPVRLDKELMDRIETEANRSFRRHTGSVRGQQWSMWDGYEAHVALAAIRLYAAPKPEAEPQEPVAEKLERLLWEFIDLQAMYPDQRPNPETWSHVLAYAPQSDRDGERLDWLDKVCSTGNGRHLYCLAGGLRQAIDAAMAAEKEQS